MIIMSASLHLVLQRQDIEENSHTNKSGDVKENEGTAMQKLENLVISDEMGVR